MGRPRNPVTGTPFTRLGAAWWTVGAQKGVGQPPYMVRWRGRWDRTLPVADPSGPSMHPDTRAVVCAMPVLECDVRRCLDDRSRTRKRFQDLLLWCVAVRHTHVA